MRAARTSAPAVERISDSTSRASGSSSTTSTRVRHSGALSDSAGAIESRGGKGAGRIVIDYSSLEQLDGLLAKLR